MKISVDLFDSTNASWDDGLSTSGNEITIHFGYAPNWDDTSATLGKHECEARAIVFSLADKVGSLEELNKEVASLSWNYENGRVPFGAIGV
jgi:hypothetical protein